MFENLTFVHFLIIAITVGFCAAIVYTNIQRTALCRFIKSLIENDCSSCDKAKTLEQLGLYGIYASIARSSVKSSYGLKKHVHTLCDETAEGDSLERALDGTGNDRYYLDEACDKDLLIKRYGYETMPFKKLIPLIAALCAAVIIVTFLSEAVFNFIKKSSVSDTKKDEEASMQEENITSSDTEDDNADGKESNTPPVEAPAGPTIPV